MRRQVVSGVLSLLQELRRNEDNRTREYSTTWGQGGGQVVAVRTSTTLRLSLHMQAQQFRCYQLFAAFLTLALVVSLKSTNKI